LIDGKLTAKRRWPSRDTSLLNLVVAGSEEAIDGRVWALEVSEDTVVDAGFATEIRKIVAAIRELPNA
jgi:hypothetical protein